MTTKKLKKSLLLVGTAVGLVVLFQNCGPTHELIQDEFTSLGLSQEATGVDYHYTKSTPVYFDLHMVPTTEDSIYQNYDMIGVAALSDGREAALNYEIEVLDQNNMVACPTRTGILAASFTRIQESCAKRKTSRIHKVTFRIKTPDGEWHEYVKNFIE